jgi:tetratricopeptide (TPR) repeat protein
MSSEPNWLEFFEDRERRYADFYLDFAQQHARRDPEAYDNLEAESGNLLKIAGWLAEQNKAEDILKLAEALWQKSDFLRTRGFLQRGLPLLENAYQAARQLQDLRAEIIWLEALAQIYLNTGNPTTAQPLFEQALALAQDSDDLLLEARSQLDLGRLLMDLSDLDHAGTWLIQALRNYRQIQNYTGTIETLVALGNLLSLQGNSSGSVAYLEQGLFLAKAQQDHHGEAALRYALGYTAAMGHEWQLAIIHFKIATDMARTVGDLSLEVRGLHNLGEAWLALGDVQKSITLLEKALVRQETIDDVVTKAFTHFYLAKAYYALNDPDNSLIQLKQVYPLRHVPLAATFVAESAWIAANNYLKLGQTDAARTALYDFLELAPNNMADIRLKAKTLLELIENYDDQDDVE